MRISKDYKKHSFSVKDKQEECVNEFIKTYKLEKINNVVYKQGINYYVCHIHKMKSGKVNINYWIIPISDIKLFNMQILTKETNEDKDFKIVIK